ncbi:MAG: nucleotidyltransferase domain-containing protein [Nitrospirota bacterium]|nr:nucleotidyltransferase domain-containing protein [Nitrospirota bacterium]
MFSFEKNAIKRATEKLKEVLGDNLIAVAAFGSRVRGDFSQGSDFDILVVVRKRTFDIIDIINNVFGDEEDRTDIPFSVVVKGTDSFEKEKIYNTTFYRNIKREGIVLHGRT